MNLHVQWPDMAVIFVSSVAPLRPRCSSCSEVWRLCNRPLGLMGLGPSHMIVTPSTVPY